jgi:hypothetical protein
MTNESEPTESIERDDEARCECKDGTLHWGDVSMVQDGGINDEPPVYACEAHWDVCGWQGSYEPPPAGCTTIRTDAEEHA